MLSTSNSGKIEEKLDHSYIVGIEMQNIIATVEKSVRVSYETKNVLTVKSSNCTLEHLFQRNENLCSHKILFINVHRSFIWCRQTGKSLNVLQLGECLNNLAYISNIRDISGIKTVSTRYNLDGSTEKYPEWRWNLKNLPICDPVHVHFLKITRL